MIYTVFESHYIRDFDIVTHVIDTFNTKQKNFTLHTALNFDIICAMKDNNADYNIITTRELLKTHGFSFSKSMGQNFLVDENIPRKIVKQSGIDKSYGVLEVGPGAGALTAELSREAGFVTSVELDKRLVPMLLDIFSGYSNVSIVQGDILKLDIKKLVDDNMSGLKYHVCANLPYNITTPAITAFLESGVFDSITVMLQKEVAQRICAKPGSPEYGAFTVYINYHAKPVILFDVPPECFTPRPKVTSSVIKMEAASGRISDKEKEKIFFKVMRSAFGQRRKTLVNALFAVFNKTHSKDEISEIVENSGFDKRIRGEMLSLDDFMKIASHF